MDLVDWMMIHNRGGRYAFYDDLVKECVQALLTDEERKKAHEITVRYYERFYDGYRRGDKSKISEVFEYLYHLVECSKLEKVWEIVNDEKVFYDLYSNVNLEEFAKVLEKFHKKLDNYERAKIASRIARVYSRLGWHDKSLKILQKNFGCLKDAKKLLIGMR